MISIITIAFNNLDILKIQYTFLKKYLINEFEYIIVDNSTNVTISTFIYEYCISNFIIYIKTNIYNADFSISHGLSINYAIRHLKLNNEYILLLDHDIIPIIPIDLLKNINTSKFYGCKHVSGNIWNIWPGLFLFKNTDSVLSKLDFLPCAGLDTGGSNYYNIFKLLKKEDFAPVITSYYCSLIGTIQNYNNSQYSLRRAIDENESVVWHKNDDMFEYIDGWIHFINTSNWNNKRNKISQIIDFTNLLLEKI